ncbi:unnamed protein product, partial [Candidula unifasciata]
DLAATDRMFGKQLGQACQGDEPPRNKLQEILVDLERPYFITWLRLHVSHRAPGAVYEIRTAPKEYQGPSQKLNCQQFPATATVVDILCQPGLAVPRMLILGPDVCSVSVSG